MKSIKQYAIGILCIGMFLSCATAKVSAIDEVAVSTEETVKTPETLVGEITDKREVNIKTFLTSDFRYQAYIYPNAVHYRTNGKFEDIDNRLIESKDDSSLLENTANAFKIKFSKNTNASKIISFSAGTLGFSWGFEGLNKTVVAFDNNDKNKSNKITDITETQVSVLYTDAFLNTDLQYILVGSELKENFILKAKGAPTSFTQTISIQQGSVSEEKGKIVFKDKDGVNQYEMGQLYMSDASGEFSSAVTFSYVKTQQGINLTISADPEWINDPSRVYPITIDPSIQTSLDKALIEDVHVSSGMPGNYFGGHYIVKSGYGATSQINYTYLKFDLPKLAASDLVVSATLEMYVRESDPTDPANVQVNVYEVTSNWAESSTTWNNKPTSNSTIEDYEMVASSEWVYWDVTKVAKKWYTTDINYGLLIKNQVENANYKEYYSADTSSLYLAYRPNVVITYVNTNGLEDLWTYTSQDMGRAGTAFVNNSTGNLTLMRDDLSISGGKMPVGITSFYNYDAKASGVRYSWRTNYEQTISLEKIGYVGFEVDYYKYTDGDGTAIYFYYSSGKWIDELGKGLELTIDTNSSTARYVIKDKSENTLEFSDAGYLVKLKDNAETPNSVNITYASGLIDYIVDSSGRKFDYVYNASNRLSEIDYLGTGATILRRVQYEYGASNDYLQVTAPDGSMVKYYYDVNYQITKAVNLVNTVEKLRVNFEYFGNPMIIKSVKEYSDVNDTSIGNQLAFAYTQYETTITDKYSQDVYYQFDNYGRTICIKDTNNAAQYYEYGATGGSQNKLTSVSKLQTTTVNLAKNISFEATSDWAQLDSSGTLNTPSYSTTSPLLGTKSLSIVHPGTAGRIIYAYENIPVSMSSTQKASYTLSAYVKSSVVGAAHLSISINGVTQSTSTDVEVDAANVWQRISSNINISGTTVTSLQIRLVVDAGATVYFDGVQLETGVGVNRYNMVENPSLEYITSTTPNGWTATNMAGTDGSSTATSSFNSKSYFVNGSALTDKSLSQTITVSGNAGDVFSYGGWAKAIAAPKKSDRSFQVTFTFNNTDTTITVVSVPFNNPSTAWQYAEGKAVAVKAYSSVKISFDYKKQLNTVYFDGAQVYREEFGQTYLYDDNGNLVSAKDMEGNSDLTSYDSSNQLLKQVNADGTYVAYDYDNFHRVMAAQSSTGVSTKITYDAFGNPISTTISNAIFGNDLIAYYKFDGNMNDSSGNGYNGTNYSGSFVSGRVGNAIRFNGTTQYAELSNFKVPDVFSISMWVKNERIATNECLIGKNTTTGGNQLLIGEYNSKIGTNINASATTDVGIKTLGYQFIAVTFEKISATQTQVKIYKDMELIGDYISTGLIGDTSTGKIWALGMEWDSSTKSDFFQGSIDELAFYKGALDEKEIKDIYAQANTKQLVAKYDFNTASGGTIADNTNNGHTATYTGGITFASGAMVLNGSSGYMQLDDFYLGQDMTVAMTIKSDVVKSFSLFAKHDSAGNNILIEGYYAGWHTRIRDDSYLAGTLVANTTYTVVYTIKQINANQSRVQMYVNGTPQFDDNRVINAILADTTGKPWVIGQEWDGSTASDFFDGSIDNLAIYNYEMSSTEVSTNSTALTSGTYNPGTSVYPITCEPYKSINSSASYTADGNYITSVTDSRGNTANYDYDPTYGRLNSFRAPDENSDEETDYTYDANTDLLTSVSKTVDSKTYTNSYTYDLDKLTKITHNGFDYEFTYDSFGNPLLVKVAGTTLITNTYQANNGLLDYSTYGNGAVVKYEYDSYHRVIAKKVNTVLKFEYTYDNQGNLSSVIDHAGSTAVTYSYFYDFMNRLAKVVGSNSHNMLFTFDSFGRMDTLTNVVDGTAYKNEYVYGDQYIPGQIPGQIYNVKLNGATQLSYAFDQLARLSTRTISGANNYQTSYTYLDGSGSNSTTTLLASMTNGSNAAFNYTYDANGNILTIKEGTTLKATYTYDKMNQLIREDNVYSSKSIDYIYDIGGNIVGRTEYVYSGGLRGALIDTFDYVYSTSWKDQMTSYDGESITYDSIGNPLSYRDGLIFTWANGRELTGVTNGTKTGSYTYNDSGIRTSKTYDEVTTNYYLNGSSIVRQTDGAKTLDFFYDENSNLYSFKEAGSMYYYLRNGQNDIIGILNSSGVQVVYYTYDSWGNPKSTTGTLATTVGADNPFRYRGYYFDSDTGLYYLNSRYYDSEVGRFINADECVGVSQNILGSNLYSYALNNPINYVDKVGDWPKWIGTLIVSTLVVAAVIGLALIIAPVAVTATTILATTALGGTVGLVGNVYKQVVFDKKKISNLNIDELIRSTATGAVSGTLSAVSAIAIVQGVGNGVVAATSTAIGGGDINDITSSFGFGVMGGLLSGAGGYDGFVGATKGLGPMMSSVANSKIRRYLLTSVAISGIASNGLELIKGFGECILDLVGGQ